MISDLKNFRKCGSITPGHPELGVTPGVEATTGPLGQGLANAVGMAMAEKILAATYNRPGFDIISHNTYAFVGDGCLMEGISHEACSLAGTLGLNKLILFWDDNGISIDGEVKDWFSENVPARFRAYGFFVIENIDGHNHDEIADAVSAAQKEKDRPTLICCKTKIAYGSPSYENTSKAHGAPLGENEIQKMRINLGWPHAPFEVPDDVKQSWDANKVGAEKEQKWNDLFRSYETSFPDLASDFISRFNNSSISNSSHDLIEWVAVLQHEAKAQATRQASQSCIEFFQQRINSIIGGSADLSCSNLTEVNSTKAVKDGWANANYVHYGVREFAMFAIANGLSSYGGFIPFCGTFFTFIDYGRNALRLAAMAKQRVIYVLTHDSIGLGEDGPTHQPVEHNSMLRAMPNVRVWRPCDSVETAVAWYDSLNFTDGPTCLLLSRQKLKVMDRKKKDLDLISKGGYILKDFGKAQEILFIATGSEVELVMNAAQVLNELGIGSRVVSMPCVGLFLKQDDSYRDSVLDPKSFLRIAVEAGSSQCWHSIVGSKGLVYGLDRYGESGTGADVMDACGFTTDALVSAVKNIHSSYNMASRVEGENYVN